jgi:hypothetical protein
LPCFRGELETLRGVNVDINGAAKDPKIGEARVTFSKRSEGDKTGAFRPRAITNIDHCNKKGKTPKAIWEGG